MKWFRLSLGPLQTNAYILKNEHNECIIFDPGAEGPKLIQYIKSKQLAPVAILLTHAHFDHIGAVDSCRKEWSIPVYIHKKEKNWLEDPGLNGSSLFLMGDKIIAKPADEIITEEQTLQISSFTLQVFETPGHSPGSVSYYAQDEGVVFSGDALFAGGIGRTDLPGGSHQQLINSIHQKLLTLPEETIVLSGHGPETTIEMEMNANPFLNGF
ncbi:MBL fold metallo-hydrolase [Bacillus sp. HMF5848]|uniref:MBL fold metallo-hydrolase n=1 Tax=Bacillus sp. HMF5848 TaxID=2495421 RepID=UPI000F77644C|nr:MBL fold metallo-hydrolase [Bacillus sp. HMF5848]RSK29381.1 MBL fold metallo-hydrolase [Bacillus sp. HMF5848]